MDRETGSCKYLVLFDSQTCSCSALERHQMHLPSRRSCTASAKSEAMRDSAWHLAHTQIQISAGLDSKPPKMSWSDQILIQLQTSLETEWKSRKDLKVCPEIYLFLQCFWIFFMFESCSAASFWTDGCLPLFASLGGVCQKYREEHLRWVGAMDQKPDGDDTYWTTNAQKLCIKTFTATVEPCCPSWQSKSLFSQSSLDRSPTTIGGCLGRAFFSALTHTRFFLWKLCFSKSSCLLWPDGIPRKRWRLSASVLSSRAKREKIWSILRGQRSSLNSWNDGSIAARLRLKIICLAISS